MDLLVRLEVISLIFYSCLALTLKNTLIFLIFTVFEGRLHAAALFLLSIFVSHRSTHHQAIRNGSSREARGDFIHFLLMLSPSTQKYPGVAHFHWFLRIYLLLRLRLKYV